MLDTVLNATIVFLKRNMATWMKGDSNAVHNHVTNPRSFHDDTLQFICARYFLKNFKFNTHKKSDWHKTKRQNKSKYINF